MTRTVTITVPKLLGTREYGGRIVSVAASDRRTLAGAHVIVDCAGNEVFGQGAVDELVARTQAAAATSIEFINCTDRTTTRYAETAARLREFPYGAPQGTVRLPAGSGTGYNLRIETVGVGRIGMTADELEEHTTGNVLLTREQVEHIIGYLNNGVTPPAETAPEPGWYCATRDGQNGDQPPFHAVPVGPTGLHGFDRLPPNVRALCDPLPVDVSSNYRVRAGHRFNSAPANRTCPTCATEYVRLNTAPPAGETDCG